MSFVLRHRPEAIGLALDAEGWSSVSDLIVVELLPGTGVPKGER